MRRCRRWACEWGYPLQVLSAGLQLCRLVPQGRFAYPQTSYWGATPMRCGRFLVVNGHPYLLFILKSPFFIAIGYFIWHLEMENRQAFTGRQAPQAHLYKLTFV